MTRATADLNQFPEDRLGIGTAISGERPAIRIEEVESSPDDRARTQMERALRWGQCSILSDEEQRDGVREQRTGWLMADGTLVLTTWYQGPDKKWSRGSSTRLSTDSVTKLADLFERNGV